MKKLRRYRPVKQAKVNLDTVLNLSDQIQKYLAKTGDVNTAVNDFAMGIYAGFSNFYKNDDDDSTDGAEILDKVIVKLRALLKEYPSIEVPMPKADDTKTDDDPEEEDAAPEEDNADQENDGESQDDQKTDTEKVEQRISRAMKWGRPNMLGKTYVNEARMSALRGIPEIELHVPFRSIEEAAHFIDRRARKLLIDYPYLIVKNPKLSCVAVRTKQGGKIAFFR